MNSEAEIWVGWFRNYPRNSQLYFPVIFGNKSHIRVAGNARIYFSNTMQAWTEIVKLSFKWKQVLAKEIQTHPTVRCVVVGDYPKPWTRQTPKESRCFSVVQMALLIIKEKVTSEQWPSDGLPHSRPSVFSLCFSLKSEDPQFVFFWKKILFYLIIYI